RIRHKLPLANESTELALAMTSAPAPTFAAASPDLRLAFAVAAFADVLRGGATWSLEDVRAQAAAAAGHDKGRNERDPLTDRARSLRGDTKHVATDSTTAIAR